MSSHRFLLRRVWHLAIPTPLAMGYSPTEYAEFTEPPAEVTSHGFLLRMVWHLAIPTPPAMGYSPTEYAEFTEPPTEMSSHGFHRFTQILRVRCSPTEFTEFTEFGSVGMAGMPYPPTSVRIRVICGRLFSARSFRVFRAFCGNLFPPTDFLLRRVWHLAILTPPAMGYSPTEYAEFTEPPTEMSSHGFHRSAQILRVRCSPTEFTEYTEFGSVGMAGMPYPPTSVLIRVICGRLFSARRFRVFRAFCGNIFSPTDFSIGGYGILPYPRRLLWDILPRNTPNSQNLLQRRASHGFHRFTQILRVRCSPTEFTEFTEFGSVGMAGMPYPPNLCSSVSSVGGSSLQEVLCIRCIPRKLLHRLFCWCSRDCCTPWRNPQKLVCTSQHLTSPRTQPSACPPSTVGTTSSPLAAR